MKRTRQHQHRNERKTSLGQKRAEKARPRILSEDQLEQVAGGWTDDGFEKNEPGN